MAQEGFSKITVDVDLSSGQDVANVQQYMRQFEQVMKNLTESGQAFSSAMRRGEKTISKDFYVDSSKLDEAKKGFEFVRAKTVGSGDTSREHDPFTFSKPEPVQMESFKRLINANKREIAELKATVARHGGSMSPAKQAGYYDITMPNAQTETSSGRPTTTKGLVTKRIRDLNYESRKAEKAAYDEKASANYAKFLEGSSDKESAEERKMTDKFVAAFKKRPKDGDGKPTEGDGAEESGKSTLSSLAKLGTLYLIIKYIQMIADFAKKIFDAVSTLASQTKKDATTGLAVGLSAMDIRKYSQAETLKSLPQGTVVGALQTIVQKFGVPSQMDSAALGKLAMVLRSNTVDVVQSGLGGKDPEAVMDLIVQGYIAQALSGRSAEGVLMSVPDAARNLGAQLESVSQDLAHLFRNQLQDILDKDDPARSQSAAGPTSSWLLYKEAVINPRGMGNTDTKELLAINKTLTEIQSLWKGIKDGILLDIANILRNVIGGLRNSMRIGMTPMQRYLDIEDAKRDNRAKLADSERFEVTAGRQEQIKAEELRRRLPAGIRDKVTTQTVINSAEFAAAGSLPIDPDILLALKQDPKLIELFYALGNIGRSRKAAAQFTEKLKDSLKDPETKHVVGSVTDTVTAETAGLKSFNIPEIQKAAVSIAQSRSPLVGNASRASAQLRLDVANQLAATYALGNNAEGVNNGVGLAAVKSTQDLSVQYYLDSVLRSFIAKSKAEGTAIPGDLQARVVSTDNMLTIRLMAGDTTVLDETRSTGLFDMDVTLPVSAAMLNAVR